MHTQKLYYTKYFCPETLQVVVTAEFAGIKLELNEINKKYDAINLVTSKGVLNKPNAILRYLTSDTPINGTTPSQRSQLNTWYQHFNTQLLPLLTELYGQVFGQKPANQTKYQYCITQLTKNLKTLDDSLKHKTFFVGHNITVFDITLTCYLENLFKLIVTQGERKKLNHLMRWYHYVRTIPIFTKFLGKIVLCGKQAFKIQFKTQEKTQSSTQNQSEQKKSEKKTEKKSQESNKQITQKKDQTQSANDFKLDDFKRQFQNSKNQTEVLKNLLNNFNKQKLSIWKIHYDKDPSEGKVLFLTQNLANGSLQRIQNIRKVAFGTWGVYGDQGNYEVRGVMIWQGIQIHPIWKQHPAFEYHKFTQLSPQKQQDRQLILDYVMESQCAEGLMCRYTKRIV